MSAIPDKEAKCLQIEARVRQGCGVVETCRAFGMSEKTFQRWRKARRDAGSAPATLAAPPGS